VKLVRATKSNFLFHLSEREKALLLQILSLYPSVPPGHQRAGKSVDPRLQESRRLLDDALAQHRDANKKIVQAFITDPRRFTKATHGSHLSLSPSELEWLLQILNDVNVGSWLKLGSPNPRLNIPKLNEKNAQDFLMMGIATEFQASFLEALEKKRGE
jgi:hypothetical protein